MVTQSHAIQRPEMTYAVNNAISEAKKSNETISYQESSTNIPRYVAADGVKKNSLQTLDPKSCYLTYNGRQYRNITHEVTTAYLWGLAYIATALLQTTSIK